MSQTSAPYVRSFTQALDGTPTVPPVPADIAPLEMWVQGTAAFNLRGKSADAPFALASGTVFRVPANIAANIRADGTGTLTWLVFGNQAIYPDQFGGG
jgi:hypothetical protein